MLAPLLLWSLPVPLSQCRPACPAPCRGASAFLAHTSPVVISTLTYSIARGDASNSGEESGIDLAAMCSSSAPSADMHCRFQVMWLPQRFASLCLAVWEAALQVTSSKDFYVWKKKWSCGSNNFPLESSSHQNPFVVWLILEIKFPYLDGFMLSIGTNIVHWKIQVSWSLLFFLWCFPLSSRPDKKVDRHL